MTPCLFAVALCGCVTLAQVAPATEAVAIGALACDWGETTDASSLPGYETNPILGRHPSDNAISWYFGGWILVVAIANAVLPNGVRVGGNSLLTILEAVTLVHNHGTHVPLCGVTR